MADSTRIDKLVANPTFVSVLVGLITLCYAAFIDHSLIHSDEVGYVLNGRRMLGGASSQLTYFPGYSVFLTPVLAITRDPDLIVRGVQVVNAILAGITAALSWRVLRLIAPQLSRRSTVGIVLVTSLYPAFRLFGTFALSENLLIPLVLALGLAMARAAEARSLRLLLPISVAGGLTVLVHPRAIALVVATVAVGLFLCYPDRRRMIVVTAGTMVGAALGVAAARLVLRSDAATFDFAQSDRTSVTGLVTSNIGLRQLVVLPFTALGQLFYLSVGTIGLAPLGVLMLGRLIGRNPDRRPVSIFAMWIAALSVASLLISSLFMNQGTGDKAIYGRYLEAVVLPLLLLGAVALHRPLTMLQRRALVLFPAGAAAVLLLVRGPDAFDGRRQLLNISAVQPITDKASGIDILWMAVVGVVLTTVVVFAGRRHSGLVMTGVAVCFIWAGTTAIQGARDGIDNLARGDLLAAEIQDVIVPATGVDVDCISVDQFDESLAWHQQNLRLRLLQIDLRNWRRDEAELPCSDLIITGDPSLADEWPGARAVAADPQRAMLVWALAGGVQDSLAAAGLVGASDPIMPLPSESRIDVRIIDTLETDRGDTLVVRLVIANTTDQALFPSPSVPDGFGGFALGLEWRDPLDLERLGEPRRVQLPGILWPGDQIEIEAEIGPTIWPAGSEPVALESGTWILRAEMVQEGIRWLEDTGADETSIEIEQADPG